MNKTSTPRKFTRRDFLKLGGQGALLVLLAKTAPAAARQVGAALNARTGLQPAKPSALPLVTDPATLHLAATDGHILLPGRDDPLYVFGFLDVTSTWDGNYATGSPALLDQFKGNVTLPAPIIGTDEGVEFYLALTNIGLVVRPDLDDSHTIHWHGFPNAASIFDGVPEVSIAVPPGRTFPYYYKPVRPGTYMYHCHFEDVEHVQMGMDGIVYVRPGQNSGLAIEYPLGSGKYYSKFAYNDGDGHTGYDREFALLLNEFWTTPHDNLESIQESVWPDYKANYWVINGRVYPDTAKRGDHPDLELDGQVRQPVSSLIQLNPGDRVLLRFANLGYEQHTMQLPGIEMRVVGEDATLLGDKRYSTHTLYIGPGEARDVIIQAPLFDGTPGLTHTDDWGTYNVYYLKNRSPHKLVNAGVSGLGGMMTEVRVYGPDHPASAQTAPNQTYGSV